jgi:hypothetical protein
MVFTLVRAIFTSLEMNKKKTLLCILLFDKYKKNFVFRCISKEEKKERKMSAKMTQRRRQLDSKRSSSINNEHTNGNPNAIAAAAAARRRNQHRHYPTSTRSRFDYFYKSLMKKKFPITIPSYVTNILIGLLISFSIYKILITIIDYRNKYEYTNVPIKLPKLVNVNDTTPELSPQRFWGTYRYERIILFCNKKKRIFFEKIKFIFWNKTSKCSSIKWRFNVV